MATVTSSSGISSILGTYSGIGSDQIDKLIEAESTSKYRAQAKIETINKQKTVYSDVKTRLTNLLTKISDLSYDYNLQPKKATSTDSNKVAISAGGTAIDGTYDVKVSQLATSTRFIGAKITDNAKNDLNLSGTLTLTSSKTDSEGNNKQFNFDIATTDSLGEIATKINKQSKDSGITAIVMDGRLVLSNTETGDKSLDVVDNELAQQLGLSKTVATASGQVAQVQNGLKAQFSINGIEMESNSNTIDDKVDGLTFTLNQKTDGDNFIRTTVANDTDKTISAVQSFVDQYNSTYSFIKEKLDVGTPKLSSDSSTSDNKQGDLVGDSLMMRLQMQLRTMATSNPNQAGVQISQLGISVDREGVMSLDKDKLSKALADNPDAVKDFFKGTNTTTTTGETETTTHTNGYVDNMKNFLNSYLKDTVDSSGRLNTGFLKSRTDSLDTLIKDLNKQVERFDEQLDAKRTYYVNMFTKLDAAMMQAEEQMNYFAAQTGNNNK